MTYNYAIKNQFQFYGDPVSAEKVLPTHQKAFAESIRKYFLNLPEVAQFLKKEGGGLFDLSIGPKEATLTSAQGKSFSVALNATGIERVARIARYYQNLGRVRRDLSKEEGLDKSAAPTVDELRKAAIPGTIAKSFTAVKVGESTLALTRDILSVHRSFGPDSAFVSNSGFVAGSIWGFFSIAEIMGATEDYTHAKEIGDGEGARRAEARVCGGLLSMFGSTLYLSGKAWDATVGLAPFALDLSTNLFFGAGALLGMGVAGLGIYRCSRFLSRIDRYLENPDTELSDAQKLKGALRFLKDTMSVTPEEKRELTQKIDQEHKEKSPGQRRQILEEALRNLSETKVKYLKRRTSNKSLALMLDPKTGIDALLPILDQGGGVEEAKELIRLVKRETNKKIGLYFISFIAALAGLLAVIAGTVATGGILPFVLLGISASIYLVLGSYNLKQYLSKKDTDAQNGADLPPLDLSAAEAHEGH